MVSLLTWILTHRKVAAKWFVGLAVAFLLSWGITLHRQNKMLSEGLEIAQNNIEAYQGSLQESWQANNVLKLDMSKLSQQNDDLIQKLDSVAKELKIKQKQINTAATQKQTIYVNVEKEVQGDIIKILKDTVYKDSIKPNDLTTIHYTIGTDTISMGLDIRNTQYLYMYHTREYKNKKCFLARLFTLDFKKVNKYKYKIENTNDLIQTTDVRVIEAYDK